MRLLRSTRRFLPDRRHELFRRAQTAPRWGGGAAALDAVLSSPANRTGAGERVRRGTTAAANPQRMPGRQFFKPSIETCDSRLEFIHL